MMLQPPKLDQRTAEGILRDLHYLRGSGRTHSTSLGQLDEALSRVFARFCEIVIARLNEAPQKNFLAFLDWIGASPIPARSARVPITFSLAAQAKGRVTVPARSHVAAPPPLGERDPVIFETERDLELAPVQLDALHVKDGARDQAGDYTAILVLPGSDAVPVFRGNEAIPHCLYIGLLLPEATPVIEALRLKFEVEPAPASDSEPEPPGTVKMPPIELLQPRVSWEVLKGVQAYPLSPISDQTAGLSTSGEVVFASLPKMPVAEVQGFKATWFCCRLLTPLLPEAPVAVGKIRSITPVIEIKLPGLQPDDALFQTAPLDLTKEFYPFGERPRFGDTMVLASNEAFSIEGAEVVLDVELANPPTTQPDPPLLPVKAIGIVLRWEARDGTNWTSLEDPAFADETRGFSQSGTVRFRLPKPVPLGPVAGKQGRWIRVRIVSGDYGREAMYVTDPDGHLKMQPATFAPPIIRSLKISYQVNQELAPVELFAWNDFTFRRLNLANAGAVVFEPVRDTDPACYLGFQAGEMLAAKGSAKALSIYFGVWNPIRGQRFSDDGSTLAFNWEYWNGKQWSRCSVEDDTVNFRGSGAARFLIPDDCAPSREFGKLRYWLRVRRSAGIVEIEPRLRVVAPNTVMASNTLTVENEGLGSSTGRPNQKFRTTNAPVLEGALLEVLERDREGRESWIAWREANTLHASGPFDRHYVLDHLTGEVTFGDGTRGAIPAAGPAGVRMKSYRTGGGRRGNCAQGTITQLKSAIVYVEKANNLEPARGGADFETMASLVERAPLLLRHRNNAVTAEDYEDLALQATTEVARARCFPLYDLLSDPKAKNPRPGILTLVIVPRSDEATPQPTLELFATLEKYFKECRPPGPTLVFLGPQYVPVHVRAEVVVRTIEAAGFVESEVTRQLREYHHPLTGRGGPGWEFGALPRQSELFRLIEGIGRVEYVRELELRSEANEADNPGIALACPGDIVVKAVLEQ